MLEDTRHISQYCSTCAQEQMDNYFSRWKTSVDEANCAAQLRRQIGAGPPTTFADADNSFQLTDAEREKLFEAQVSGDGKEWKSGILAGAPKSAEEKEALWAQLRLREAELPENPEDDEKE